MDSKDRIRKSEIGNRKSRVYIRGIFNYCDRWCERCAFSDRCRCYDLMNERGLYDPARHDLNSPEFWEQLRQTFRATKEGLLRTAAEQGIDLNDPELSEETLKHERELAKLMDRHLPLVLQAQAYALFVAGQLDQDATLEEFGSEGGKLPSWIEQVLCGHEVEVREALETVAYYHLFIYPKLSRAVYSWAEERLEPSWMEELSKDSDGSAKVALIAIDRSWLAWGTLRQHMADGEEITLESLRQLGELRQATEKAFPAARGFIRPGFHGP